MDQPTASAGRPHQTGSLAGACVVTVLAIAVVLWLVLRDDDDAGSGAKTRPAAAPENNAVRISPTGLRTIAATLDHPVYWASKIPGHTLELSQTGGGNIYVRYLPAGTRAGDPRPDFLTVGTYPSGNAFGDVRNTAKRKGAIVHRLARGGLAVSNRSKPTSVYFAFPRSAVVVEVFDPRAQRAEKLVTTGKIRPID